MLSTITIIAYIVTACSSITKNDLIDLSYDTCLKRDEINTQVENNKK